MCVCERGYLITGWLLLGGRELRSQSVFEAQMYECQNVTTYKCVCYKEKDFVNKKKGKGFKWKEGLRIFRGKWCVNKFWNHLIAII